MLLEDELIYEIKLHINNGDIESLKKQWYEYMEEIDFGREIAWDYVFGKVYIHAALKKQKEICKWLDIYYLMTLILYNKLLCDKCFLIPVIY